MGDDDSTNERGDEPPSTEQSKELAKPAPAKSEPRMVRVAGIELPVDQSLLEAAPGLARIAATAWWRTVTWGVGATLGGTGYLAKRVLSGAPVNEILQDVVTDARNIAWKMLGPGETADGVVISQEASGSTDAVVGAQRPRRRWDQTSDEALLARGEALLRRSADVTISERGHPAFTRLLTELTPDEGRILRFLYKNGPQPSIDVRTNRPLGIGSELVEGGINMIAEYAGCRNVDRIHPYLTNLYRLGLIEFSKEKVEDPSRYQVIEAQPRCAAAMKRAGRSPRTIYRSIHLNRFGMDFCDACLPEQGLTLVALTASDPSPNGVVEQKKRRWRRRELA